MVAELHVAVFEDSSTFLLDSFQSAASHHLAPSNSIHDRCCTFCDFIDRNSFTQTVAYLACAPKSNAATKAIFDARRDIAEGRIVPVPKHLRDSHYSGAEELGSGEGYVYSHDDPMGVVQQDYLGIDREYYSPVDRGFEATLKKRLVEIRERLKG